MKLFKIKIIVPAIITLVLLCTFCKTSGQLHSEYLLQKWYLNAVREDGSVDTVHLLDRNFFDLRENGQLEAFNSLKRMHGNWKLKGRQLTLIHELANGRVEENIFHVDELTPDKLVMTDIEKRTTLYLSHTCNVND